MIAADQKKQGKPQGGNFLRGNVGENQTDPPTCQRNLCSYSGYQKYSWIQVLRTTFFPFWNIVMGVIMDT